MRRLVTAVQDLSLVRDLDGIMKIVRTAARELTGADGATFVLRDGNKCHYADEDAIAPLWKGQRFPMSACISGWSMLNKKPAVIGDIYADGRIPADAYRPTFVKSLVMVPIREQAPVGAIGNYWATPHSATPEEVELLQTLANTVSVAMENVRVYAELEQRVADRTRELKSKNEELENDLALARDFQLSLLPVADADFPHEGVRAGRALHFCHRYEATGAVGGDFFDIMPLTTTKVGVFGCDVMGHGVRAALVTAIIRGIINELKHLGLEPGRFMTEMNRKLTGILRDKETMMFTTAFYMVIDLESGHVRCANAGHPMPLHASRLRGSVTPFNFEKGAGGPVLGLMPDSRYQTVEFPLSEGDTIVLYTDGVVEAMAPSGEEFGEARLADSIGERLAAPTDSILEDVLTEARRFCGQGSFEDDVCLVGIDLVRSTKLGAN